jgi:AraC-like DNA-binding protein
LFRVGAATRLRRGSLIALQRFRRFGGPTVPQAHFFSFADPYAYQAAFRAGVVEVLVTAKGDFHADLARIDLDRLWMQRCSDNLPRILHASNDPGRAGLLFLSEGNQAAIRHGDVQLSPGEVAVYELDVGIHHRTAGPCRVATMSLKTEDLAAASKSIVGRELGPPVNTHIVRPPANVLTRLAALHKHAARLAREDAATFAKPAVIRALEHDLVHAMIACLGAGLADDGKALSPNRTKVMARFEDFLAANQYEPVYVAQICAATGVSGRTLRTCCQEVLGMSPVHYLWLRRMHLARQALLRAEPANTTVTAIATDHGFWELGRFSVEYRALFGESPSTSLRHR